VLQRCLGRTFYFRVNLGIIIDSEVKGLQPSLMLLD
jgi:hypothetical protein